MGYLLLLLGHVAMGSGYSAEDSVCRHETDEGCRGEGDLWSIPDDWYDQNIKAREAMPVKQRPTVALVKPLPRLTMAQLDLPQNEHFQKRRRPFILTDGMKDWRLLQTWPIDPTKPLTENRLVQLYANEVTDFYPYNMLKSGTHPYLYRWGSALREVLFPPGSFRDASSHKYACEEIAGCRYVHLQLTPDMWRGLEEGEDMPTEANRHPHTGGDEWWMGRCLREPEVRYEYHIKTHWKIILVGSRGSGMFNHSDSLMSASWHGHVQGLKWWYVCGVNQGPGPNEGKSECFENVLKPGEILYYGRAWFHHTRNLMTPTMTITGTVVTPDNFEKLADKLHSECTSSAMSFDFSGALCDALSECYPLWHNHYKGKAAPEWKWPSWRRVASKAEVAKKDARRPTENNYDGRNWIGG